jgi:hypothetical protein
MDRYDIEWLVTITFCFGFVLFAAWCGVELRKTECLEYGEMTGYEVRQLDSGRCMVNHPDEGWTPAWREKR